MIDTAKVCYSGPTSTRGSRMIVRMGGRTKTLPFNYNAGPWRLDLDRDAIVRACEAWGYTCAATKWVRDRGETSTWTVEYA